MDARWCWEARDAAGTVMRSGAVTPWWGDEPPGVAEVQFALLLIEVAPRYDELAGWTVRAWPADRPDEVAVSSSEEWLTTLRPRRGRRRRSPWTYASQADAVALAG